MTPCIGLPALDDVARLRGDGLKPELRAMLRRDPAARSVPAAAGQEFAAPRADARAGIEGDGRDFEPREHHAES